MSESNKPGRIMAGIVAAIAVVVIAGWWVWSAGFFGGPRLVRADFSHVAPEENPTASGLSGSLRFAVSAMISPQRTYQYYEGLVKLVGKKVGRDVTFVQKKTYDEVNHMLEQKEVDIVFSCSGPYVGAHDSFGAEILAVPVVGGKKVYYSYILARKDSGVRSLADLKDKTFAFTDPDSNTGYLVPRYMLAGLGHTPKSFFRETFFTHGHDNSIKAVAEGLADGAAVHSLIWDFLNSVDSKDTSRTRIIETSPPYGIPPVIVHPALDEALKQRLQEVFLGLHEDPAGKAFLRELRIDRFERGSDGDYDSVRKMQRGLAEEGDVD